MKKFNFTLEKMLRYKNSLLEEEKNKLSQIRAERNVVDGKIERTNADIQRMDVERAEKASVGMTALEMRSYAYNIDNSCRHLKALALEGARLDQMIERQLQAVLLRTQEVSGLEKLREKQLEEYNDAARKEQELFVLELVSSKYVREQA